MITLPKEITHRDWEALAWDNTGNLFIGDFVNNHQNRKDLAILKYNLPDKKLEKISFSYPDQKKFPLAGNRDKNFDCEALLWARGSLYLFSKNKGNRNVKVYRLPDKPGNYLPEIIDTLRLPLQITGTDISSNNEFVSLLSYGKCCYIGLVFMKVRNCDLYPFIENNLQIQVNRRLLRFLTKEREKELIRERGGFSGN